MNLFRKLSSLVFPKVESREVIAPPNDVGKSARDSVAMDPPIHTQEPDVVVSAPEPVADGYQANPNHSSR